MPYARAAPAAAPAPITIPAVRPVAAPRAASSRTPAVAPPAPPTVAPTPATAAALAFPFSSSVITFSLTGTTQRSNEGRLAVGQKGDRDKPFKSHRYCMSVNG